MGKVKLISYLKKRGISKQTATDFDLGFYIGKKFMSLGREYDPEEFLTYHNRNSIIFPIFSVYGDLVAISSKNPSNPKYFHAGKKTKTLYGLYTTWRYIVKKNVAIIVEGNFDTLKCYEKGLKYVVGLLGSHSKFSQLCLLRRFTDRCILALDGDNAGRKTREKLKPVLEDMDFSCKIVEFPDGEDPDSFLDSYTKEEFLRLIS